MITRTLKMAALSLLCLGTVAVTAQAAVIVDTGTPDNSIGWGFYNAQYFSAQFNVASGTTVSSVEGYFGNQFSGTGGDVTVALHANGAGVAGAVLYSSVLSLSAFEAVAWHGVSSLNWVIAAGSYWVSFMPDGNISGTMPDAAPNPLAQYGQGNGNYNWQPGAWSHLHLGVRINGDSNSVPDQGSIALMWGLVSLLGVALHRRQKRA